MFKRKKSNRTTGALVIKPKYSPRVKLLVAIGVASAIIGTLIFVYNHGLSMAGFERWAASQAQEGLAQDLRRLESENRELREALARAQRSVQMSETAHQEIDRTMQTAASEIVKLREELNFYRNIISPSDKKPGLRIQSLLIEPTGKTGQYRYKLVLVQALKHDRTIYGSATIEVAGMQAGAAVNHRVPDGKVLQVNFKYFQDLEGKFELPRNFRPQQIRVNVHPTGGPAVDAEFKWPLA